MNRFCSFWCFTVNLTPADLRRAAGLNPLPASGPWSRRLLQAPGDGLSSAALGCERVERWDRAETDHTLGSDEEHKRKTSGAESPEKCLQRFLWLNSRDSNPLLYSAVSLKALNTSPAVPRCTVSVTCLSPDILTLHTPHVTRHTLRTCLCLNWPKRHSCHCLRVLCDCVSLPFVL